MRVGSWTRIVRGVASKEESVTLELLMIESLYLWLVGRYFPVAGVTEKFSRNLHCPTCNFLTR
ncbi:unnamed protein product, partial [Brassica oleracea var. botrytis]